MTIRNATSRSPFIRKLALGLATVAALGMASLAPAKAWYDAYGNWHPDYYHHHHWHAHYWHHEAWCAHHPYECGYRYHSNYNQLNGPTNYDTYQLNAQELSGY